MLANSGQDEFEEIFKIVIAKLFDEKFNASPELRPSLPGVELFKVCTNLLRRAENRWPGTLQPLPTPGLTPEHLRVCVQELAEHRLINGTLESFDEFFEFLVARAAKGRKGQYFTPRHVVEMCVRIMDPRSGEAVCDPACGSGGFLLHTLQHIRRNAGDGERVAACDVGGSLWGFDVDERAIRIARALMVIADNGSANLFRANSLLTKRSQRSLLPKGADEAGISIEDAAHPMMRGGEMFDVILTNPPFAGEIREGDLLDDYENSRGKNRVERDVLFLERCINLLRPGGRMAIILPHNKLSSGAFSDLRVWVGKRCAVTGVISLGRNIFMPHTQQKTGVLLLRKHLKSTDVPTEPVLLAVSERDGKDSRGNYVVRKDSELGVPLWERLDHDFEEIVKHFRMPA